MCYTSDNSTYLIGRNRINSPPQYSNVCLLIWFTSIFYIWLCVKQKKNVENKLTEGVGRSKDKKHGREAGSYITPYVLREKSDKWTEKCKPGIFDNRICEVHVNASDPIIAVIWSLPDAGFLRSCKQAHCWRAGCCAFCLWIKNVVTGGETVSFVIQTLKNKARAGSAQN